MDAVSCPPPPRSPHPHPALKLTHVASPTPPAPCPSPSRAALLERAANIHNRPAAPSPASTTPAMSSRSYPPHPHQPAPLVVQQRRSVDVQQPTSTSSHCSASSLTVTMDLSFGGQVTNRTWKNDHGEEFLLVSSKFLGAVWDMPYAPGPYFTQAQVALLKSYLQQDILDPHPWDINRP